MNPDRTHDKSIHIALNGPPAKGNPIPVETEPDPEEPYRNPPRPKRKKKSGYDIVML